MHQKAVLQQDVACRWVASKLVRLAQQQHDQLGVQMVQRQHEQYGTGWQASAPTLEAAADELAQQAAVGHGMHDEGVQLEAERGLRSSGPAAQRIECNPTVVSCRPWSDQ